MEKVVSKPYNLGETAHSRYSNREVSTVIESQITSYGETHESVLRNKIRDMLFGTIYKKTNINNEERLNSKEELAQGSLLFTEPFFVKERGSMNVTNEGTVTEAYGLELLEAYKAHYFENISQNNGDQEKIVITLPDGNTMSEIDKKFPIEDIVLHIKNEYVDSLREYKGTDDVSLLIKEMDLLGDGAIDTIKRTALQGYLLDRFQTTQEYAKNAIGGIQMFAELLTDSYRPIDIEGVNDVYDEITMDGIIEKNVPIYKMKKKGGIKEEWENEAMKKLQRQHTFLTQLQTAILKNHEKLPEDMKEALPIPDIEIPESPSLNRDRILLSDNQISEFINRGESVKNQVDQERIIQLSQFPDIFDNIQQSNLRGISDIEVEILVDLARAMVSVMEGDINTFSFDAIPAANNITSGFFERNFNDEYLGTLLISARKKLDMYKDILASHDKKKTGGEIENLQAQL